jgi:hypothetical protein
MRIGCFGSFGTLTRAKSSRGSFRTANFHMLRLFTNKLELEDKKQSAETHMHFLHVAS